MTPLKYRAMLGKGLDVDWSKTGQGIRFYNPKAATDFKAAGLSHVRIRVTQDAGPALFASLDRQVTDCLAAGLIPIIAYQGNAFKESASQADLALLRPDHRGHRCSEPAPGAAQRAL